MTRSTSSSSYMSAAVDDSIEEPRDDARHGFCDAMPILETNMVSGAAAAHSSRSPSSSDRRKRTWPRKRPHLITHNNDQHDQSCDRDIDDNSINRSILSSADQSSANSMNSAVNATNTHQPTDLFTMLIEATRSRPTIDNDVSTTTTAAAANRGSSSSPVFIADNNNAAMTDDSSLHRLLVSPNRRLNAASLTSLSVAATFIQNDEDATIELLENFARNFKQKRIKLGYTQGDVGAELGKRYGTDFSQTTISRFEALNLSFKNMCKLKPLLQEWLNQMELSSTSVSDCYIQQSNNHRTSADLIVPTPPPPPMMTTPVHAASIISLKKRRKRTNLDDQQRLFLLGAFELNSRPDNTQIVDLSHEIKLDPEVVRVWFCNRRQKTRKDRESFDPFTTSAGEDESTNQVNNEDEDVSTIIAHNNAHFAQCSNNNNNNNNNNNDVDESCRRSASIIDEEQMRDDDAQRDNSCRSEMNNDDDGGSDREIEDDDDADDRLVIDDRCNSKQQDRTMVQ